MCGSSYAEIQVTHFSMLAVIWWWLGYAIPFSARIYYLQNNMASFVVTKNLQAHINVSTMHYSLLPTASTCTKAYTPVNLCPCRLSRIIMTQH